jgi:HSP20 family molecular chaperone IbpA
MMYNEQYLTRNGQRWLVPATQIIEEDGTGEVTIVYEIPGIKKGDLNIMLVENRIELSAETGTRRYFQSVSFRRPPAADGVDANYENGMLVLKIKPAEPPKMEIAIN